MQNLITQPNILFALGLLGIIYTVFKAFYDPQKKSETNDLLMDQKANFLNEMYEKRFAEIQSRFNELATQNQNHLHSLDVKIDGLCLAVNQAAKDIIRLETIINERIPRNEV